MREEQMHVILHTADDEGLAFEIREDAAEVAMEFVAEGLVPQEWPPFLGREHEVEEDFGERLRHGGTVHVSLPRFNPFRVDAGWWTGSQGSRCAATLGWMMESRWDSFLPTSAIGEREYAPQICRESA